MSKPTEIDWAYFAGIVDGEGCITCNLKPERRGSSRHSLHFTVVNTNPVLIDWIQHKFGGNCTSAPGIGRQKTRYVLYFPRDLAVKLLKSLEFYLKLKRRQAIVYQKLYPLLVAGTNVTIHSHVADELYAEMKYLNQLGVSHS